MPEQPRFACEKACPLGSAMQLAELAVQVTLPEAWLYDVANSPFSPPYSEAAVRTASAHFNVSCPTDNPVYGSPRVFINSDQHFLEGLAQRVEGRDHVEAEELARLQAIATSRDEIAIRFSNLTPQEKAERFAAARPFLDDVAVDAFDQTFPDPYAVDPAVMQGPASANRRASPFRQLYDLDQRAFVVARRALEVCTGPLLLERRTLRHPFQGEVRGICPNGSNDLDFFRAYQAQLNAPREAGT